MTGDGTYPTSLGVSDETSIRLLGLDLAEDLMGHVGFGELAFWLVALRRPSAAEVRLFEACLLGLADHGFVPTAIAARQTYLSAPDSLQGAVAAGLLGGGSRFLGVTEDAGRFLREALAGVDPHPVDDEGWDAVAVDVVREARAARRIVPGLGHPTHTADPRVPRLYAIAAEADLVGPHLALFAAVGRVHDRVLGRSLPLNGAGVIGAALADLGLPQEMLRGFALLARCAGLLGQIAEEQRTGTAREMYLDIHHRTRYVPPTADPADR